MARLLRIIGRDLRLAFRQRGDAQMVVAFFVLTAVLFPLGVGPGVNILARIGGGVIWVVALLACLLSLERLFLADFEDGALDQLVLLPAPLELVVLGKAFAHWLTAGLPLVLVAPLLAVILNLPAPAFATMILALLLGTPTLSLIGAIGAALILGSRRGGVLLSLLLLPLYIPVLIFGVSAVDNAAAGFGTRFHMLVLAAMLLGALALAPLAAAAALRQAIR